METDRDDIPASVKAHLKPFTHWRRQSFEYYAAHFLVGSGLISGDLAGNVRSLARELRTEYERGVEDGQNNPCARSASEEPGSEAVK